MTNWLQRQRVPNWNNFSTSSRSVFDSVLEKLLAIVESRQNLRETTGRLRIEHTVLTFALKVIVVFPRFREQIQQKVQMIQSRWISLLMLTVATGCHLRPNFGPPGTIGMQRSRAVLHDPYPSNELGPQIVGGRPLGFDRPQAETEGLQGSPFAAQSLNRTLFDRRTVSPQTLPPIQPGFQ